MKIAVLISGRGTNLQAIIDAGIDIEVVVGDFPASGLARAKTVGIDIKAIDHTDFPTRESFDQALLDKLEPYEPELIILAGFMRILTPVFIERYQGKILNIHPSLLPKYPGLNTHQRALDAGDKWHGCTVHYVTPELDQGPIIAQSRVPVLPNDTVETLANRVLEAEHQLYPNTIKRIIINTLMSKVTKTIFFLLAVGVVLFLAYGGMVALGPRM